MKIENLTKDYVNKKGTVCKALKGFNAEFADRGLVFLLGKSGCGKSTLINIIGGIDTPTSGSIVIEGTDIATFTEEERDLYRANNVGFIFQNFNLFEQLNVYENVVFGISDSGEETRRKADEILKKLDISECKSKNINELSGGQQQRVAIARALMKDCKILLADEPSGNLDETNGKLTFDILKEISTDRLVLVVTHDRDSAFSYGDTVIEMQDGAVVGITQQSASELGEQTQIGLDRQKHNKKFSAKTNFKLSFHFMVKKKLKMIFSVLLLAVSLGVMGVTFMCYQYDLGAISASVLAGDNAKFMELHHGFNDPKTKKYDMTEASRPFDGEWIDGLGKKYDLTGLDKTYYIYGMCINENGSSLWYLRNWVTNATVTNPDNLKKYGFDTIYGKYPSGTEEIAVTDFLADSIAAQVPILVAKRLNILSTDAINDDAKFAASLKRLDTETLIALFGEQWETEIAKPETLQKTRENIGMVLLNETVSFGAGTYKITAIIKTDYREKYGDLLENSIANEDARGRDFFQLVQFYYNNFYVDEAWIETVYNGDSIKFGNQKVTKYSAFANITGLEEPKDDEILMSKMLFKQIYGEDFAVGKQYVYNNGLVSQRANGQIRDVVYEGKRMKVVGVFDATENPSEIIYNDRAFDEYKIHCKYIQKVNFDMPQNESKLIDMINEMREKEISYNSTNSYFTYNLADIMDIFKTVFLIVSVVLGVFSAVLMYNYFSMIIQNQKKEIGIMRALGVSNSQIMKIYLLCGVLVMGITVLLSWIVTSVMGIAIDKILVKEFIRFANADIVSAIHILTFSVVPYAIILAMGLAIAVVSTVLPILRIKRLSPINAIRNE